MNQATVEALETLAFSLMGRLHVQLRREIGRVTDIKYMSINAEYCQHVLELAKAVSNPDLLLIAQRLEDIYFGESGLFGNSGKTRKPASAPARPAELSATVEPEGDDQHYVGRLR